MVIINNIDMSEKDFQKTIVTSLMNDGFKHRNTKSYDKKWCFDVELLLKFIKTTQKEEWERYTKYYGDKSDEKFLYRLSTEIEKKGTINVLREPLKDVGCNFNLYYKIPNTTKNPDHFKLYEENILSVVDELEYENKEKGNRLDLVVFLNGIPLVTIELKDTFSQGMRNAINQYKQDRDSREKIFQTCLVHFAMSDEEIAMTTKLDGQNTRFLPFNKDITNPDNPNGFKTSYLYEEVLTKESLINIITNFVFVETSLKNKKKTLIFPRYHQLDCVNSLYFDCKISKKKKNYLIQHSAGSGKTKNISWLAHRLTNLNDEQNNRVFDTIIVVSDRKVIDNQLQNQIKQFEKKRGLVKVIDKNSSQLKDEMINGGGIIVTTIQKFKWILDNIQEFPKRNYAVIIDEAHSSQSGSNAENLKKALFVGNNLEEAEKEDAKFDDENDFENLVNKEIQSKNRPENVSFFAYTATPKQKTLEMFGTNKIDTYGNLILNENGNPKFFPYHVYSMEQAIKEGFILDVLENYMTVDTYFKMIKKVKDDPQYDKGKATKLLMKYVEGHSVAIDKKLRIMLDHFNTTTINKINGKAKAMIVTSSRQSAVKYKLAFEELVKELKLPYKSLVAFTGNVKLNKNSEKEYTEDNLNKLESKETIEEAFERDEYKILIVANKFQTGFDQPLLHTMYVDKILQKISAVQTLSRLNRTRAGKDNTAVIDFRNKTETIRKSFEPYYQTTILSEGTDPNKLYGMQDEIFDFLVFDKEDINNFIKLIIKKTNGQEKLHYFLSPIVEEYKKLEENRKQTFKKLLIKYNRIYSFLSQILPFSSTDLEKLYQFIKVFIKKIPVEKNSLPYEVLGNVDLDSLQYKENKSEKIKLEEDKNEIYGISNSGKVNGQDEQEYLSKIVDSLNKDYGDTIFKDEDKIIINQIRENLRNNVAIKKTILNNKGSKDNAKISVNRKIDDEIFNLHNNNIEFYNKYISKEKFKEVLKKRLFEEIYNEIIGET